MFVTKLIYSAVTLMAATSVSQKPSESDTPLEKIDWYVSYGCDHVLDREYEKAIECFKNALAIDPKLIIIELADAYFAVGRSQETIAIYRRALQWDPVWQDFTFVNTGFPCQPAFRYAILLARNGKEDTAKEMYYLGLRKLYVKGMLSIEPLPLLVVFDGEKSPERWTYSSKRLEAAALTGLVISRFAEEKEALVRIQKLAPDWHFPFFYKAFRNLDPATTEKDYEAAERLAPTESERTVIRKLIEWRKGLRPMPEYPRGDTLRSHLKVLQDAKKRLQQRYAK